MCFLFVSLMTLSKEVTPSTANVVPNTVQSWGLSTSHTKTTNWSESSWDRETKKGVS